MDLWIYDTLVIAVVSFR